MEGQTRSHHPVSLELGCPSASMWKRQTNKLSCSVAPFFLFPFFSVAPLLKMVQAPKRMGSLLLPGHRTAETKSHAKGARSHVQALDFAAAEAEAGVGWVSRREISPEPRVAETKGKPKRKPTETQRETKRTTTGEVKGIQTNEEIPFY